MQRLPLRTVTVVEKVEAMEALPPATVARGPCRTLHGRAEFTLVDNTGSLSVESVGSCFLAAQNFAHDDHLIQLTAEISVYIPEGQTTEVMKALTNQVRA